MSYVANTKAHFNKMAELLYPSMVVTGNQLIMVGLVSTLLILLIMFGLFL